jgi:hypothetical protein
VGAAEGRSREADKAGPARLPCRARFVAGSYLEDFEVDERWCETQAYAAESAKCGLPWFRGFSGLLPMLADQPSWRNQEVMWGHNLAAQRYISSCRRCQGASCDCETRNG